MPENRIEILDKTTIDKIAAGEVVERPASVMKELLENAIDAGATAVTAEIRDGGIAFLRVTDNGSGIASDQMRTAFLRHATSKLRDAEELTRIRSLGFRGEALSSIAAVAQVECISKTPEALTGCRLSIEGGEEKEFEEIGAPSGTTIVVRNLFFNTPARAKFLKTPQTEASHVSSIAEELALSHPDISFKYIVNGQTKLFTSGNGSLKEIAYQVFGRDLVRELIPVTHTSDLLTVRGFVGTPAASRGNRSLENYFVNGRFVKNNILTKAVEDAYHGHLMQHRFPFVLLYLDIDCEKTDVNVHPSKMEIRLSSQEEIYHQLCLAIQNALMSGNRIPEMTLDRNRKTPSVRPAVSSRPEPFETNRRRQEIPQADGKPYGKYGAVRPAEGSVSEQAHSPAEKFEQKKAAVKLPAAPPPEKPASDKLAFEKQTSEKQTFDKQTSEKPATELASARKQQEKPMQQSMFSGDGVLTEQSRKMFRMIGQVFGTYWLIEYGQEMLLIDQHAAHEKVMYERMMKAYRDKKIMSQMLYPAIILHPGREEGELLRQHLDTFSGLGFDVEEFGQGAFKISAVPSNLYAVAGEDLFIEVLGSLEDSGETGGKLIPEKIASMSCKAAVKGDHLMSPAEADALIDELLTLEDPYHCPHGRPVMIRMSRYELDRKFKRIV